jgi:hypothetical protein
MLHSFEQNNWKMLDLEGHWFVGEYLDDSDR